MFQYVAINALYNSSHTSQNGFPTWYNQVATRNWWLHPSTTVGTPVADPQSSVAWLVDMGPNVPVDPRDGIGAVPVGG